MYLEDMVFGQILHKNSFTIQFIRMNPCQKERRKENQEKRKVAEEKVEKRAEKK